MKIQARSKKAVEQARLMSVGLVIGYITFAVALCVPAYGSATGYSKKADGHKQDAQHKEIDKKECMKPAAQHKEHSVNGIVYWLAGLFGK